MVFELVSKVTARNSIEFVNFKCALYQSEEKKIPIKNIFMSSTAEYAEFAIFVLPDVKEKPKLKKKKSHKSIFEEPLEDLSIPEAFFISKPSIKVRKGETQFL